MATKRVSPSDLEHSPVQCKQARIQEETETLGLVVSSSPLSSVVSAQQDGSSSFVGKIQTSSKSIRSRVAKTIKARLGAVKSTHEFLLKEKFFLENGGNLMDILIWKKKPNVLRDQFLKQHEVDGVQEISSDVAIKSETTAAPDIVVTSTDSQRQHSLSFSTTVQIPLSTVSPTLHATPPKGSTPLSPSRSMTLPSSSPRPATRAHSSFSSVYENSHEDIVMRARHEAEVMKSIGELRKEGLWSASRLPKVQEPTRIKTHWDYLLEEMQWLATDFNNEKRWKINAARKVLNACTHNDFSVCTLCKNHLESKVITCC